MIVSFTLMAVIHSETTDYRSEFDQNKVVHMNNSLTVQRASVDVQESYRTQKRFEPHPNDTNDNQKTTR